MVCNSCSCAYSSIHYAIFENRGICRVILSAFVPVCNRFFVVKSPDDGRKLIFNNYGNCLGSACSVIITAGEGYIKAITVFCRCAFGNGASNCAVCLGNGSFDKCLCTRRIGNFGVNISTVEGSFKFSYNFIYFFITVDVFIGRTGFGRILGVEVHPCSLTNFAGGEECYVFDLIIAFCSLAVPYPERNGIHKTVFVSTLTHALVCRKIKCSGYPYIGLSAFSEVHAVIGTL